MVGTVGKITALTQCRKIWYFYVQIKTCSYTFLSFLSLYSKANVTNCVQICLTGTEHSRCKASCDTREGNCDQRMDNGAANCSAKKCTQTCAQPGFGGKCSFNCTGYRCFQLCNDENQCKLSCDAAVEICHQVKHF